MTTEPLCDWCDQPATVRDLGGGGIACPRHRRELGYVVRDRAARSGNRWTGEAAEAAVRPIDGAPARVEDAD